MRLRMFLQKLVFAVGFALCWIILLAGMFDIANYVIGGVFIAEAVLMIGDEKSWTPIIITGAIGVVVIAGNAILSGFFGEAGDAIVIIVLGVLPVLTIVFACMQFSMSKIASDHTGGTPFKLVGFLFPVVMIIGSALAFISGFTYVGKDALRISGSVVALVGSVAWAAWVIWARILYIAAYGNAPAKRSSPRSSAGSSTSSTRKALPKPNRSTVETAARYAAIDRHAQIVDVSGSTGNIVVKVKGTTWQNRELFNETLASKLSDYDVSGISVVHL